MLLDEGVDIAIVQEVLGHSSIQQTRKYLRVSLGLTRRAADRMEERLYPDNTTDLATERKRRRGGGADRSREKRRNRR